MARQTQQIKALETQISKKKDQVKALQGQQVATQTELTAERKRLKELNRRLESLRHKKKKPTISDHAIVRYLERVKGMDIVAVKAEMLNPQIIELTKKLGHNGEFPSGEGWSVRMKNGNVVTVIA